MMMMIDGAGYFAPTFRAGYYHPNYIPTGYLRLTMALAALLLSPVRNTIPLTTRLPVTFCCPPHRSARRRRARSFLLPPTATALPPLLIPPL